MLNDHIDVESELLKYYSSRTRTKVYILTTFLQLVVTLTRVKSSFFQSGFLIDIFLVNSLHWNITKTIDTLFENIEVNF